MIAYPDSSFLYSIYLLDKHSAQATEYLKQKNEPLCIGSLLHFEFCQAVRFAIARKGLSEKVGLNALTDFHNDLSKGVVTLIFCKWSIVHQKANLLSEHYTIQQGYRTLDILHIATALTLGAKEFLTFDKNQAKLAR